MLMWWTNGHFWEKRGMSCLCILRQVRKEPGPEKNYEFSRHDCCNSGCARRSSTERIILVTKSSYSRDLSYYVGKTEFNKVEICPPMWKDYRKCKISVFACPHGWAEFNWVEICPLDLVLSTFLFIISLINLNKYLHI